MKSLLVLAIAFMGLGWSQNGRACSDTDVNTSVFAMNKISYLMTKLNLEMLKASQVSYDNSLMAPYVESSMKIFSGVEKTCEDGLNSLNADHCENSDASNSLKEVCSHIPMTRANLLRLKDAVKN
jgi:hypothetical protein